MSIYYPILNNIDLSETRRYAGLAKKVEFEDKMLIDACTEMQIIATPKATWLIYPYNNDLTTIESDVPLKLDSKSIIQHLTGSAYVAVLAVTVGAEVENAVTTHFTKGNYTRGFLLDAAATTAVETAADQVSLIVAQEAKKLGLTTTKRFSPGYGDWDITNQPEILRLACASSVGISTTTSCMLIPRKSVTAVIGLRSTSDSSHTNTLTTNKCQDCNQRTCLARRESHNDKNL